MDIKVYGSLDLDEKVLRRLDIVIGSVHSKLGMTSNDMTKRLIAAMETDIVNIIGHPTGRLLTGREPYPIDMEKVLAAAGRHKVIMELNAYPDRLDLNDVHCRMAKEMGVMAAISSDSHVKHQMGNMVFGVNNARRGWLEKKDVLNTRTLSELVKVLRR